MSSEFVADANLLISFLDADNSTHDHSVQLVAEVDLGAVIWVHPVNLAEVLSFYPTATERASKWAMLQSLAGFEAAHSGASPRDEAMGLSDIRAASRVSMPDVCALFLAHTRRATLLTHDRRLRAAARRFGVAVLPDEDS